jgi:hypothetical protein
MSGLAVMGYVLGVVVAAVVVWFAVRRRPREALAGRLVPVIRAARRRAMIAVLFAATVFLVVAVAGITMPQLLGLPFAVAPLIAGAAGMLLYGATPPRLVALQSDEPRVARLVPRSVLSALPARRAGAFLAAVLALVVLLIFGGVTATLDEDGRSRVLSVEAHGVSSWARPYPGWFYGIPVLIALAVLVVSVLIALHRISTTPAFPRPSDADIDARWRRGSVEVILGLGTGSVLFALGGIAAMTGISMVNVMLMSSPAFAWSAVANTLWIGGGVALVLSIVSVALAGLTAAALGEQASGMRPVR